MTKQEIARERLEKMYKIRIAEILSSPTFCLSELFDMCRYVQAHLYSLSDGSQFVALCESVVNERSIIIKDLDLIQEYELKQFCKEKGLNLYD